MVPNLDAMDASDRLRKFKQTFEVNKGKWDNYSSGEELFGLAVTKYPELEDIQVRGADMWRRHNLLRPCAVPVQRTECATSVCSLSPSCERFWDQAFEGKSIC